MSVFKIAAHDLHWLDSMADPAEDLCLHGHAVAVIGERRFEYDAAVSASALYLLKSVSEDHIIGHDNQMLPCCGFMIIAEDSLENVSIVGCSNGVDWSVVHEGNNVRLITEDGYEAVESIDKYRSEVFAFADMIEAFYLSQPPRKVRDDKFDRNGYTAFWNEWHRRRGN